ISLLILPHTHSHSLHYQRFVHSFPTRRSSDLYDVVYTRKGYFRFNEKMKEEGTDKCFWNVLMPASQALTEIELHGTLLDVPMLRSEEHTSELQSRENLVCRLLLEKTKELPLTI